MAISKIGICNIALAHIGADAIRSFDDNNKRSRMCEIFYEPTCDVLLAEHNWSFARKLAKLQLASISDDLQVTGMYPYRLPSDCLTPIDILPLGNREYWFMSQGLLYSKRSSDITTKLLYTARITNTGLFTSTFSSLLGLRLAQVLAPTITQNKDIIANINNTLRTVEAVWIAADANIGNVYRAYNDDPNNDTFVNPDKAFEVTDYDDTQA